MVDPVVNAEKVSELTDFTFALRIAGLAVTMDRTMDFLRAVSDLRTFDEVQIFWAGRAILCAEPADFDIYDDTFDWFFRHEEPTPVPRVTLRSVPSLATRDGAGQPDGTPDLTAGEEQQLRDLLRLIEPGQPAPRPSRRTPAPQVRPYPGRLGRVVFRGAQLSELPARRGRPPKLVLLIDASRSMAPYQEALLRFAHRAKRRLGSGCEVFGLGSTLIRLTAALSEREPHRALEAAVSVLPEPVDGVRLAPALRAFLDQHGQRGMARGAVVMVLSDAGGVGGIDQAELAEQARRLRRLSRSFVWVNPGQEAVAAARRRAGIEAVQPFCDHLLPAHSLATLGEWMDATRDA